MQTLRVALAMALAMALAIAVAGCGDDNPAGNDGNNNNNNNGTTFTSKASGTINGNAWTAINFNPMRTEAGGLVIVAYVAHGPDNSQINFGITNASVGTFQVAEGSANQADFNYGGKSYGKNESGTIKIDALTAKGMRGSFNVTAKTSAGETGSAVGTFEAAF